MKSSTKIIFETYAQRSLMALVLALLVSALLVAVAAAHAVLVESEPENSAVLEQTPAQVIVRFDHELETKLSSIHVFDTAENQVDNGDGSVDLNDPDHASILASLPESLPNGKYSVHWKTVSAHDGDTTEGEFFFKVADPGAATSPELATNAAYAGHGSRLELIMAFGVLLFVILGLLLHSRLARDR